MNPFEELSQTSKILFERIQTSGPLTKNDLVNQSKMKLTSLNRAIKPLIDYRLIDEVGIAMSSGGRKPTMYDVSKKDYFLIGIDLSRTYFQVVLTDLKASVRMKKYQLMTNQMTPLSVVESLKEMVKGILDELEIPSNKILGIGLGTIGPMDIQLGKMLYPKKFLSNGWDEVEIVKMLEKALELPVVMENGANTAIYIEQKYGVGRTCNSLAYFNCGIGIRTSVMNTNQMIRNEMNYEDTFAHMVVDMTGEQCSCGKYGCIESYATLGAIERKYQGEIKKGAETSLSKKVDDITYSDICNAADNQELLALRVINEAAVVFATGLSNFVSILSPELVILSGPLIRASNIFYENVVKMATEQHQLTQKNTVVYHKQGQFKEDAIAIGAAMYVLRESL